MDKRESSGTIGLKDIGLKYGDRAALIGMTGMGKSELARHLLQPFEHVHVFDEKNEIKWPGYEIAKGIKAYLQKANAVTLKFGPRTFKYPRLIYRPTIAELEDLDVYNEFFRMIYLRGKTVCFVDEVFAVCPHGRKSPSYFKAVLTRGRSKEITGLFATQRPVDIPKVVITESNQKYIFRLQDFDDRKRIEKCTGIDEERILTLPKFQFFFKSFDQAFYKPMKLNL